MIYGVFSDVHSNLEALDAVLSVFKDHKVGGYICCGDLVGYGPQPNECLERVHALKNLAVVCGNHDLAAVGRMDLSWFNPYARAAAVWTGGQLTGDCRAYLEGMTARIETERFTVAHGTPRKPPEEYLLSARQFKENIPYVRVWPLFVGHSHMPLFFKMPEKEEGAVEAAILDEGREVKVGSGPSAFNPGSVGQPRDQDSRACCGIYDEERGTFRILRVAYDIDAVQEKIRKAGLPEFLAVRLAFGQ